MCRLAWLGLVGLLLATPALADPLPRTQPLTETGDLARKMVDGIHTYLDRELAAASKVRDQLWKAEITSNEALIQSLPQKRDRLRKLIGAVDAREKPRLEYVGGPGSPSQIAQHEGCTIHTVRWAVLPGVDAEGLLIEPKSPPRACVVAVGHCDQLPEELAGLKPGDAFALKLALQGCRVLIPTLINRDDTLSGNARLKRFTNFPHREWIHRMAYEMGRTLPGFEVQKILAAVDGFALHHPKLPVGVIGHGEGGMLALFAGALDDRLSVTQVSGYFGSREHMWEEPIDRNIWCRVREFGDAELGAMITPRVFLPDTLSASPMWSGPRTSPGRSGAAPGRLLDSIPGAQAELQRLNALFRPKDPDRVAVVSASDASRTFVRVDAFLSALGCPKPGPTPDKLLIPGARPTDPVVRHQRQFEELVAFNQKLWRDSEPVRKDFLKKLDPSSLMAYDQSTEWYRTYFHEEVLGKLPEPTRPLNPRSRQLYDEPRWTGHEVMLDVYPDVFAFGIVLIPKNLKPGEKRPVVVCQHGLEGRPTVVTDPRERTKYYQSFGAQLADRGYIVFAPQNPYIFDTHFRQILRKANPLKLSLFSFIVRQHQRILDWLETLPQVDAKRIGFYGLSYGGKTAMRVPAIEKRYALSICSADFNEWVGKIVSTELPMSYMFTREYDMLEFDLGQTFNYAEMAHLIAPRPFMVERGHDDGVGIDEMVAYEYAKIRYLYANRLKIPDRTAIEFSVGGHEIFLKGTLAFLEQHLGKP